MPVQKKVGSALLGIVDLHPHGTQFVEQVEQAPFANVQAAGELFGRARLLLPDQAVDSREPFQLIKCLHLLLFCSSFMGQNGQTDRFCGLVTLTQGRTFNPVIIRVAPS